MHSFSKSSMPFVNLFKNCGYYWTAAFVVAWDVARMASNGAAATATAASTYVFTALFFLCKGLNAYCHLHLASLRTDSGNCHSRARARARLLTPILLTRQGESRRVGV